MPFDEEELDPHGECAAEIARLRSALVDLRITARVLFQNSLGCAANHYGHDHELNVVPGWLADAERHILAAEAALSN